ncbi:MAG: hypothetical protein K0Q73_821 [Paenibacillus sp.]|jgi:hypothetical protein|nr:hypothetical protein [Paenibacillus sp.]
MTCCEVDDIVLFYHIRKFKIFEEAYLAVAQL